MKYTNKESFFCSDPGYVGNKQLVLDEPLEDYLKGKISFKTFLLKKEYYKRYIRLGFNGWEVPPVIDHIDKILVIK